MNAYKFGKFISRAAKFALALTFCIFFAAFFAACGEENTPNPDPPIQSSGTGGNEQTDPCENGHSFGEYKTAKAATCKEAGKEERVCSVCGKKEERDIPILEEHSFGEYKTAKEATCKEAGKEERVCSVCGKKEERDIPKLEEHTFGAYLEVLPATCKEVGKEERVCAVCGKKEERDIPVSNKHTFHETKVLQEATCSEAGKRTVTCEVCGKEEEREIPATGKHTFVNGKCECGMEEEGFLPQAELFSSNVFQIETYDFSENRLGTCTGFVYDETGLFIAYGDVFQNAYSALAIFETESGNQKLKIQEIGLKSDKGFLIGKIKDYDEVSSGFRAFSFGENFGGEGSAYFVGALNGKIQVSKCETKKNDSAFDGKAKNASYFSAAGEFDKACFGGIFLDREFNAVGLLCGAKKEQGASCGFALLAKEFSATAKTPPKMQSLAKLLHPEREGFVELFDRVKNTGGFEKKTEANGVTAYVSQVTTRETNSSGMASVDNETHAFRSDFTMEILIDCSWENGDRLQVKLTGKWNDEKGFGDISFECKYTWKDGQYYTIRSSSVSYNADVSKTLPNYTKEVSSAYEITESNIEYAKKQFNYCYEWLLYYEKG